MSDSIISLQNVSKHFGQVRAVDEVNFEIRRGEFFSLLGPSGCGSPFAASAATSVVEISSAIFPPAQWSEPS